MTQHQVMICACCNSRRGICTKLWVNSALVYFSLVIHIYFSDYELVNSLWNGLQGLFHYSTGSLIVASHTALKLPDLYLKRCRSTFKRIRLYLNKQYRGFEAPRDRMIKLSMVTETGPLPTYIGLPYMDIRHIDPDTRKRVSLENKYKLSLFFSCWKVVV